MPPVCSLPHAGVFLRTWVCKVVAVLVAAALAGFTNDDSVTLGRNKIGAGVVGIGVGLGDGGGVGAVS